MKETKEKFPGVNGEIFIIRIIETGMFKSVEINLIYMDGDQEKQVNLKNDSYNIDTNNSEILEKTKRHIQAITIIKQETGIDLLKKNSK